MSNDKRIWVERRRLETVVHVREWPTREWGFTVCSSNEGAGQGAVLDPADWKDGDLRAIHKRLGGGALGRLSGADKGRILFALGYFLAPSRWDPVGALLYTVPARKSSPIVVFRVCLYQELPDRDKVSATALLIRCAKNVAAASGRGGGRLRWEVDPRDAGQLCRAYGFDRRGNNRDRAVLECGANTN